MQTVYRLRYTTDNLEVAPLHMWGTMEAIRSLGESYAPMDESARLVDPRVLDAAGFIYEDEAIAA